MSTTKQKTSLLEKAIYYKERFGLDFVPLRITKAGKKPLVRSWEKLQNNDQNLVELKKLNWKTANGMGMINKTIITLDFDDCNDVGFIKKISTDFGGKYWLVKTGRGFHQHIIIEGTEYLGIIFGQKGVYKFYPKINGTLKHIEVRVSGCYSAFPPSKHFNGNCYEFIDGEPDCLPDKIDAKKLIEVLNNYFILLVNNEEPERKAYLNDELSEIFTSGTIEGNRHNSLVKLFGAFYTRDINGQFLKTILLEWNKKNKPPYPDKEINYKINDLLRRYDKGLDGIFIQFNNCLLELRDDNKLKLEKIICFGVVEYDCDKKIIKELGLEKQLAEYHQECKSLVEHYENWTGRKDQIVRVGKTLILDAYYKRFRFEYFCIYVGIISYLGRNKNKPAKKVSYSNIQYRAIGYKNENEFLRSGSTIRPYKMYTVRKAIEFLTEADFIRKFVLVKGQMIWFSTFIITYEKLAEWVKNYEMKKLKKKKDKEEIRLRVLDEIRNEENELKNLRKK